MLTHTNTHAHKHAHTHTHSHTHTHARMQALTATSDGDVVVWDEQGITAQMGTRATDRRASKLMRIHQQVRAEN